MSEKETSKQEVPEQLMDILLVMNKAKKKIEAVIGIDENGALKTTPVNKKNQNQFIRVDRQGDVFTNFFSNFISQLKNPTQFTFFKVPEDKALSKAKELQKHVDSPGKESETFLSQQEVKVKNPEDHKPETNNTMETKQNTTDSGENRFKAEQIDWETISNLGLTQEKLEKRNLLEPLLKGFKTNELVPISLNLGTAITRLDARLSLQTDEDGKVVMAIHGIRKEPQLNFSFFGHDFTKEDKENLLKTGNMGRVVELTHLKTNEKIPSIISVDRLTNELVALRADKIKIPEEIKGVKLNQEQKQTLLEGRALYLENMTSKKGEPFSATVQFNADKRYTEFLFDKNDSQKQTQSNTPKLQQEVPLTVRGRQLTKEEQQKFKEGQTLHITDFVDKQGKEYKGYVTLDQQSGKTAFSFSNPNTVKEAPSAKASEGQTKTNSESKKSSTAITKDSAKSVEKDTDHKEHLRREDDFSQPVKSKGRKM